MKVIDDKTAEHIADVKRHLDNIFKLSARMGFNHTEKTLLVRRDDWARLRIEIDGATFSAQRIKL